ncbi:MAG: pyruvate formate-lyase-activating protein [Limnospira sp. PMC 1291.21]|uniref:Pyruvate formate-lyase-activating enzyme n=3 Tax=Limnospira TaxID=2596745 RepID=A0A9P1KLV5_9CYAN|nr:MULTISPECIES: pyruvate formate-lyase-activating protein [Limnospira]MDC0836171.1 pyruvate formate-lyase-activating protein [Limnoraphis robusta]QJB29195.1 pyruvate formate lyase-activating protein [Limnospira fusiformis SAG 85.79]EDZ95359.1 pyruvate formate-lyase activating enzyme [Limnospira maxima CS-328]MDT9176341.1 pyruvate formate-lyase-activating protein [Limnospira sp. PMC 1238.20]MDT9187353.1 pyruvate formate-lyase-activating protein [Limnospira sp. PMC 894.15]
MSDSQSQIFGQIHSYESCGTVDGPGIRFVVFTQGCPLRCLYCHNPDCQEVAGGQQVSVEEIIQQVVKYRSYMRFSNGGITVTGGEPLMQPEFVAEIFRRCRELGIHTALDTSGYIPLNVAKPVLDYTDLVLLDIKSYHSETYRKVTCVSVEPTLNFAKYLHEINKPTWVRFVLVPNLTNDINNMEALAKFVSGFTNVEKVEILPFHKMGEYKWEEIGYEYKLKDTPEPTPEQVSTAINIFEKYGLAVVA